jgi:NADPH-dependent ferric siderophore reductase
MSSIREELRLQARSLDSRLMCEVSVAAVEPLTPSFGRVVLEGDGIADYSRPFPADAVKLMLPPEGEHAVEFPPMDEHGAPQWARLAHRPVLRAFTVRYADRPARRVTIDVAVHDSGAAMTWLRTARKGDRLGLFGIRRDFHPCSAVDHHLLVADATALPAAAAILESLPPGVHVTAFVQSQAAADQSLVPGREGAEIYRLIAPPQAGAGSELEQAVRAFRPPEGRVQVWIAAESGVVRSLRRYALDELATGRDDLHAVAYWKAGQDSGERDDAAMREYPELLAAGHDLTDPAVVAELEFDRVSRRP